MAAPAVLRILTALVLAPLLLGVINRVKAIFAGRQGRRLSQPYRDLFKLARKGAVYSRTTTWIFKAAPVVSLAAILAVLVLVPLGPGGPALSFTGDFILAVYLLALARAAVVLGALDTGSSFEGMGASREAAFSALAEPALFLCFLVLAASTHGLTLGVLLRGAALSSTAPELALAPIALFIVLLAENSRIPVDDPNTHLELTMIHEVMILDHSGPDLAFIEYGAAVKLWIFCAVLTGAVLPPLTGDPWLDFALAVAGVFACAACVGVVESVMARLRLPRVPKLLALACACATIALILTLWR
ncbi:MAG: NADH-quinone oxidoreductase subunit H [Desulfovibrionaceae bacterium]|nr:NADH-quinone oxidoreductase subunit H [Desulfovibrionaceae bacterium]MBF0514746.1 NADH-quinone oxidoreductase subunit H [Desulfovibrionaceae bacterium]